MPVAILIGLLLVAVVLLLVAGNPVQRYLREFEPLKARTEKVMDEATSLTAKFEDLGAENKHKRLDKSRWRSELSSLRKELDRMTRALESIRVDLEGLEPPEKALKLHKAFEEQLRVMIEMGDNFVALTDAIDDWLKNPLNLGALAQMKTLGDEAERLGRRYERLEDEVDREYRFLKGDS